MNPSNEQTELDKLLKTLETWLWTHRHDITIDTAKKILAIDPQNKQAYYALIISYINSMKYEELLETCTDAIKIWPNDPELYFYLYFYYLYQGGKQYTKARDLLKKAIELDPTQARYFRALGEIYLINREPKKAIKYLNEATFLDPDNAEYRSRQALALVRNHKVKEALNTSLKCLQDSPDDEKVLDNAGMIYILSGELDKAEELFREALRKFPTYNYFQSHLEWVLREKKDRESRLAKGKKYTPLYIRHKGNKRWFDEEAGE